MATIKDRLQEKHMFLVLVSRVLNQMQPYRSQKTWILRIAEDLRILIETKEISN